MLISSCLHSISSASSSSDTQASSRRTINTGTWAISGNGARNEISLSDPDLAYRTIYRGRKRTLGSKITLQLQLVDGHRPGSATETTSTPVSQQQLEIIDRALKLNAQRQRSTSQQLEALKSEFPQKLELIKQFDSLQGNLTIAQQNLAGLVSARETFQLEIAQSAVPWRLLIPPSVNPKPIGAPLNKNLLQSAALALFAGVGAGLLRDRLDHVFHNPGDVKDDLGCPFWATSPLNFSRAFGKTSVFSKELDRTSTKNSDGGHTHETAKDEINRQQRYQRFSIKKPSAICSPRCVSSTATARTIDCAHQLVAEGESLVVCSPNTLGDGATGVASGPTCASPKYTTPG